MSQERNDDGQFSRQVSLDDVVAVIDTVRGPVVTSGDVAEHTGCSLDSARRKLEQLREQGILDRRRTAGRLLYWRIDADESSRITPTDPIFTDRPTFASRRSALSDRVDELLYGGSLERDN